MSVTLAPDDVVRSHADAAANAREPLLVLEPLIEFLDAHGLAAPADLSGRPVGDGHSNVTFALSTEVILRRPRTCPSRRPRRSCTATTAWATRCSRTAHRRGWWRSSTGRWPRSATPSPISAT